MQERNVIPPAGQVMAVMSQRVSIIFHGGGACTVAAFVGTAISVGLADTLGRGLFPWRTFAVGAGAAHVVLIVTFTVMGENIIEDVVKAVVVIALGLGLGLSSPVQMLAVPFAAASAAILAIAANAYTRWIVERRSDAT